MRPDDARVTERCGLRLRRPATGIATGGWVGAPPYNARMDGPSITIQCLVGNEITSRLGDVARLRMAVFRDWPYLYAGDMEYERGYLATYARSPESVCVLAFDRDAVVGASTGIPLADETPAFQLPFRERDIDVGTVFYCGESVLLPAYRGRGIGHAFFDHREAHARALGRFDWTAFCAVDRDAGDPRRPAHHRGNEAFWQGRGYRRQPDMTMHLDWDEIETGPATHALSFWLRPLEREAAAR